MQLRAVRIKDDGTTIRALAIKLVPGSSAEYDDLITHTGFDAAGNTVLLFVTDREVGTTDPGRWASLGVYPRTMPVAHLWLERNWPHLPDGEVPEIDVAKILEAKLDPSRREDDDNGDGDGPGDGRKGDGDGAA